MTPSDIDTAVVFIVGSPRSGTTILGEMLDRHCDIAQWYEPYFIWDHYFRNAPDDERSVRDAAPHVIAQIRRDFKRYLKRSGARIIVDKSPRNSLRIPFIKQIFPKARFIHLLRDGRDVTLSIQKEWDRRRQIVNSSSCKQRFNYRKALQVMIHWLERQPCLEDKLRAVWFETHGHIFNTTKHLNRQRWNGNIGWGPRFKGWDACYKEESLLAFNAMQWLKCVECIQNAWETIPSQRRLEVRYEMMIQNGCQVLSEILLFLGIEADDQYLSSLPELKMANFNKWQRELTRDQIETINSVLSPMLQHLGYSLPFES